jgi:hypothetical protein
VPAHDLEKPESASIQPDGQPRKEDR